MHNAIGKPIQKPPLGAQVNWGHPLSKRLVAAFLHNEGAGGRIYNSVDRNVYGTKTAGMDWVETPDGVGLTCDAQNDYYDIPADSHLDLPYITLCVWAKSDVMGVAHTSNAFLVNKDNTNPNTWGFWLPIADDKMTFSLRLDGAEGVLESVAANDLLDTDWHFYVGTYDGAWQLLYVDGMLQTDTNNAAGILDADNSGILRVGAHPTAAGSRWQGPVENMFIFDRALGASKVLDLYIDTYAMFRPRTWADAFVVAAPPGAIMNPIQYANLGADLYDGALIM